MYKKVTLKIGSWQDKHKNKVTYKDYEKYFSVFSHNIFKRFSSLIRGFIFLYHAMILQSLFFDIPFFNPINMNFVTLLSATYVEP